MSSRIFSCLFIACMPITIRQEKVNIFDNGENLRLLHISDLHLRFSSRRLGELESILYSLDPDLVLMTGDYYDIPSAALLFRQFIETIASHYTVIFVKGNHDTLWGKKITQKLIGIYNCHDLDDNSYIYTSSRGFNYHFTTWKTGEMYHALNHKEARIILLHNPEELKNHSTDNISLILAGHLHGGQCIFYTTKNTSHFPGSLLYKYCCDRRTINKTELIVSKGLGDTLPIRINCPHEVTHITIT